VLKVGNAPQVPTFRNSTKLDPQVGLTWDLGVRNGIGKKIVWTTLLSRLRRQSKIVLAVASSRIASLLFLGSKNAHSRFKIPIDLHDESTCNITQ
jgi:hypothetical protein